jgi:hypothetical protein
LEIIKKIIFIKNRENGKKINFTSPLDSRCSNCNKSLLNDNSADLIIFLREKKTGEVASIFNATIYKYDEEDNKRPIVGGISINFEKHIDSFKLDIPYRLQFLVIIFLHQITHILGFKKEILKEKYFLSNKHMNRINSVLIDKLIVNNTKIVNMAKLYFNCQTIDGIELDTTYRNSESNPNLCNEPTHWEARILLGDYMIRETYYSEQVISEFTLALLEELGWYKIKYYTGGLMKFGKNKGCEFINNDCVNKNIINSNAISSFYNEFCSYDSIGACSSGRQSRGYCFRNSEKPLEFPQYIRSNWENNYGIENIEYCPVSIGITRQDDNYIGN